MKYCTLLILTAFLLFSCNRKPKNTTNNPNDLVYQSDDVSSPGLLAHLTLTGEVTKGELNADLKLTSAGDKSIDVQEIVVSTIDGLRSAPEIGNIGFTLKPGTDSTLSLKFKPLNDLQLSRVTGMEGVLKPAYTVLVTYKVQNSYTPQTISLKSKAVQRAYFNYTGKYKKTVVGYSFNTKNGFNEKQKKYLETLKQVNQPPFVYLSEQEIAVSGLNFRLKSYYLNDTLYADFFIVNHADFPVKFIPHAFDITNGKTEPGNIKTLTIEKISGAQQDQTMMEKGDRLVVRFKKYLKSPTPGKDTLTLYIKKAFFLTGKKPLFNEDIQLLPVIF
jgi:uncharacterized protein YcfL